MCGRYASSRNPDDLIEEFRVDRMTAPEPLEPDYNVAPTKDVYAVFDRVPRQGPKDGPAERRLSTVVWGLVPSWAKDRAIGSRLINARVETLAEKPAFKRALGTDDAASCRPTATTSGTRRSSSRPRASRSSSRSTSPRVTGES